MNAGLHENRRIPRTIEHQFAKTYNTIMCANVSKPFGDAKTEWQRNVAKKNCLN